MSITLQELRFRIERALLKDGYLVAESRSLSREGLGGALTLAIYDLLGSGGGGGEEDHDELNNLAWTIAGHVGAADHLAGWDSSGAPTLVSSGSFVTVGSLAPVALSGAYSDLTGTPPIPSAYAASAEPLGVASSGASSQWSRGDHTHPMPSAADVGADPAGTASSEVAALDATLATVAKSGSYTDLLDLPSSIGSLGDLSDVDLSTAPADEQVLTWSDAESAWVAADSSTTITAITSVMKLPKTKPPLVADFPVQLLNGGTVSDLDSGLLIRTDGKLNTFNLNCVLQEAPTAPWAKVINIELNSVNNKRFLRGGFAVRDSSTGRLVVFLRSQDVTAGEQHINYETYNSLTSRNSFLANIAPQVSRALKYIRVGDDGTNFYLELSVTGESGTFERFYEVSNSAWLTTGYDQIGFYVDALNEASPLRDVILHVTHYDDEGPEYIDVPSGVGIPGLNDLADVEALSPSNQEVLAWNDSDSEWQPLTLGAAAYSNDYADLNNKPSIPSGSMSDPEPLGTINSGSSTQWSPSDHVHPMPSAVDVGADPGGTAASEVSALDATLATVAKTGSYTDLDDLPTPVSELNDLSDVDTISIAPTNNQVLTWSDSDSAWVPNSPQDTIGTWVFIGEIEINDGEWKLSDFDFGDATEIVAQVHNGIPVATAQPRFRIEIDGSELNSNIYRYNNFARSSGGVTLADNGNPLSFYALTSSNVAWSTSGSPGAGTPFYYGELRIVNPFDTSFDEKQVFYLGTTRGNSGNTSNIQGGCNIESAAGEVTGFRIWFEGQDAIAGVVKVWARYKTSDEIPEPTFSFPETLEKHVLKGVTTGPADTTVLTRGTVTTPSATNQITLEQNSAYALDITLVAKTANENDSRTTNIKWAVSRGTGNPASGGSPIEVSDFNMGLTDISYSLGINNSLNSIEIEVTHDSSADDIEWVAYVSVVKIHG